MWSAEKRTMRWRSKKSNQADRVNRLTSRFRVKLLLNQQPAGESDGLKVQQAGINRFETVHISGGREMIFHSLPRGDECGRAIAIDRICNCGR